MKTRKGLALSTSKGFTLIELLIVIAIIAILAIIVVLNLANARDKANYARAKADLKSVSDAIMSARTLNTVIYDNAATKGTGTAFTVAANSTFLLGLADEDGNKYLSVVPTAPTGFIYLLWTDYVAPAFYYQTIADTPKTANCIFENGNVLVDANCKP